LPEKTPEGIIVCFFCGKQFSISEKDSLKSKAVQDFFVECGICKKIACDSCGQFCPVCQQWICKEDWSFASQVCNQCAKKEEPEPFKNYQIISGPPEIESGERRRARPTPENVVELAITIFLVIVVVLYLIWMFQYG
jgi:hypothetical protein